MAYQVLARRWRPQSFEEVWGQEHICRTLANALERNRVAHAYLFSGPRGVGKTSLARILAKALNCQQGPTPKPCNACPSCRQITEGISVDVQEIDGASHRGIDEVRQLREDVKYMPAASRFKVYIIDEVHMLTDPAFNALLKTLEEPPGHVKFIFATTESHKVPPTILSRCQQLEFRRIPEGVILKKLMEICGQEQLQVEEGGLRLIAREARGSLRDAESLLDQALAFSGKEVTLAELREMLGAMDEKIFFKTVDLIAARDTPGLFELVARAYEEGLDVEQFWEGLLFHIRNLMAVKMAGAGQELVPATPEELEELKRQAQGLSPEVLGRMWELLLQSEYLIKRTTSPRIALEMVLMRLAEAAQLVSLDAVLARLSELEAKLAGGPAAKAAPEQKRPEEIFSQLASFVQKEDPLLGSLLAQGKLVRLDSQELVLGFNKRSFFLEELAQGEKRKSLEAFCRLFFGKPISLIITQEEGQDMLKAVQDILGGKVIEIKETGNPN